MDDKMFEQLAELAKCFNKHGMKPVICGGLGVYLCFCGRQDDENPGILRVTNDIDLMLTKDCIQEPCNRQVIADIIKDELEYVVRKDGKYFRFTTASGQELDILTPPVEGVKISGFRSRLVRSSLHGYYTPEACFVEEDLRTVSLSKIWADCSRQYRGTSSLSGKSVDSEVICI